MTDIYCVFTTAPSSEEANRLAQEIVEQRLAACVQITSPCESIYRWQDQVETAQEFQVQIKTTANLLNELFVFVKESHSYEVPELVAIKLDSVDEDYATWLYKQVK